MLVWCYFLLIILSGYSCAPYQSETKKITLQFDLSLSPFSTVTDIEIGHSSICFLTNKHEILIYDFEGNFTYDTIFSSPRLYPNGAVEVYLNNTFNSIFHFEDALYAIGFNPSDVIRLDLTTKELSKHRVTIAPENGTYEVLHSNFDTLVLYFQSIPRGNHQIYAFDLSTMTSRFLASIAPTQEAGAITTFSYGQDLFSVDALGKGISKLQNRTLTLDQEFFFLDSILYKGVVKGIRNLSEYARLEPWQRNQYRTDKVLSVLKIQEKEVFFLVELLNRTDPEAPEKETILFKQEANAILKKPLPDFNFVKLDPETRSLVGVTHENTVWVISNLDSLISPENYGANLPL